jgi:hypothetical protein
VRPDQAINRRTIFCLLGGRHLGAGDQKNLSCAVLYAAMPTSPPEGVSASGGPSQPTMDEPANLSAPLSETDQHAPKPSPHQRFSFVRFIRPPTQAYTGSDGEPCCNDTAWCRDAFLRSASTRTPLFRDLNCQQPKRACWLLLLPSSPWPRFPHHRRTERSCFLLVALYVYSFKRRQPLGTSRLIFCAKKEQMGWWTQQEK